MFDPRIDATRQEVEAEERTWGAIGPHLRWTSKVARLVSSPSVTPESIAASVQRSLTHAAGTGIWGAPGAPVDGEWSSFDLAGYEVHPVEGEGNGFETARSIERHAEATQVLIVGEFGCGKTTLAKRLLSQQLQRQPTASIDHDVTPPGFDDWFLARLSLQARVALFELAARLRLVEATAFHVLRQRDGAVEVLPLPEDEPGVDSQVVVTAPISPNAPNARACGFLGTDGYLAA